MYLDAAGIAMIAMFAFKVMAERRVYHGADRGDSSRWRWSCSDRRSSSSDLDLSEIASASLIYLAALFAMRNRASGPDDRGLLVMIGFYTRLNNLPMAAAVAAFAIPVTVPVGACGGHERWWPLIRWRVVIGIIAALGLGTVAVCLAHVVLHGRLRCLSRDAARFPRGLETRHDDCEAVPAMISSLMMVLTASDPPQFAWHALPLLAPR